MPCALDTALVRRWSGVGPALGFVAAASASEPPPFCRCENAGRIFVRGALTARRNHSRFGGERQRAAVMSVGDVRCRHGWCEVFNSLQRSANFFTPAMFHVKHLGRGEA